VSKGRVSEALRQKVAERFKFSCAYCLTQQRVAGIGFTVDHIIPEVLGGQTSFENLCLACWDCNLRKQKRVAAHDPDSQELVSLFHPVNESWNEHFEWQMGGLLLRGKTATGRATVYALGLNRPVLLHARRRWIEVGWHPPTFDTE
jgi:hypothetical protein